jgi:hypothetical protein
VPSLAFVTPAYGRYELTAICLEQRKRLIEELDFDATCIVVADDENLDIARGLGFYGVEAANYLGLKFNKGYQTAAREGYEFAFPIGSDSFVDSVLLKEPAHNEVSVFMNYAVVDSRGKFRADMTVTSPVGCGYIFPLSLIKPVDYAVCNSMQMKGCDMVTHETLLAFGGRRRYYNYHPLQHVGFQSQETQVTNIIDLINRFESYLDFNPFNDLYAVYPTDLVKRVERYYRNKSWRRLLKFRRV